MKQDKASCEQQNEQGQLWSPMELRFERYVHRVRVHPEIRPLIKKLQMVDETLDRFIALRGEDSFDPQKLSDEDARRYNELFDAYEKCDDELREGVEARVSEDREYVKKAAEVFQSLKDEARQETVISK